jgi:hypothetical protein
VNGGELGGIRERRPPGNFSRPRKVIKICKKFKFLRKIANSNRFQK